MNYKRGDIVHMDGYEQRKYIFLGEIFQKDPLSYDRELEGDVRDVMGNEIELGMYIELPVHVKIDDHGEYTANIVFGDIEKFNIG